MASSSGPRPSSPPPPSISSPPRSSSPPPVSPPRDPSSPPRDPKSPPPPPKVTYYEEKSRKRRRVETKQDASLFHGFDLRPIATMLLESDDVESLQTLIHEFAQNPNKKEQCKTLLDSLAHHYPNSFSFKLAKFLHHHPPLPLHIRNAVVSLLHDTLTQTHGLKMRRIGCVMLVELKNPLLESMKIELEESLLTPLSEIIGNVASRIYEFSIGGWPELLEYIVSCVSLIPIDDDNSELKKRKGLMLLANLPVHCVKNGEFWKDHYSALYSNLLMLVDTPNENLQALTFDASLTLMGMSKPLGKIEVGASLLPIMLEFIDRHAKAEIVLKRVQGFAKLISLDVGEIFEGKEDNVFWCMLRLAEMKNASEELRCAAVQVLKELDETNMDVMENLIMELSAGDAQRVLKVSLDMMLCVKDDSLWLELDKNESKEAGISESFTLGKFLLNWLSFEGDGGTVVPMAIEMIRATYAAAKDWRKRHAGMIAIGSIAEGHQNDIIKCFEEVERLLVASLNDQHHRVLWATMNAIKCLSEYRLIPHVQYHMKFLAKLIPIIKNSLCPRVQAQAVLVIRFLVTNCGLDRMASIGEEIVTVMLELLKNDKQKLQEEAVETLKSVAVLIPANFRKYYATTMESLKAILFHNYSIPKFLLRAKSLECMSSILLRIELVRFEKRDAVQVMESLISLEGKLSSTDYLVRIHILKALDQFCRFPGVDIDEFINKLMPMLLRSAQLDIDLKANTPTNDRLGRSWNLDAFRKLIRPKLKLDRKYEYFRRRRMREFTQYNRGSLDDNYLVENERFRALNVLSFCAGRSPEVLSANIDKVSKIFVRWLGCSSSETQKASVLALPNLLLSVKSGAKNVETQIALPVIIVQFLVEALHKETDDDMFIRMLRTLPRCIQISGLVFTTQLIKMIADEINHILSMQSGKIIRREIAQEAGTSEGGSEHLQDEEIILSAKLLITATTETFKARFLPYVDDLLSTVALLWGNDFPDRVKAIALSTFNIIVQHFPNKLQMYHDIYTYVYVLLKACRDESHEAQLEAARGIGFCAGFGGYKFKTVAKAAISCLYSLIEHGFSIRGESGDGAKIYDMAVSALGKICEFHRENIDGPEVIRSWLNFLPLTSDRNEARYAHRQLSKMFQRSDADLLGPNNENLPKIISVFREILFRSGELATEETFKEIIDYLNQHDGMP